VVALPPNIIAQGRSLMGTVQYRFQTEESNPPLVMNCHTFVRWLLLQQGVNMPVGLATLLYYGTPVEFQERAPGDIIFTNGHWGNYSDAERAREGVGHVGILATEDSVLHACFKVGTVTEDPLQEFLAFRKLRGIYRIPST